MYLNNCWLSDVSGMFHMMKHTRVAYENIIPGTSWFKVITKIVLRIDHRLFAELISIRTTCPYVFIPSPIFTNNRKGLFLSLND